MRILGIDPSLHSTGYGMIDTSGRELRLVEGGVLAPARSAALPERLAELQRGLLDVIRSLQPDAMVVEEIFSRPAFPRTAILMAHARGALVCAAALRGLPVYDYAATRVKRALVGRGAASKAQVAAMVVQTLRLRRAPDESDVTDALALAITHARRSAPGAVIDRSRR